MNAVSMGSEKHSRCATGNIPPVHRAQLGLLGNIHAELDLTDVEVVGVTVLQEDAEEPVVLDETQPARLLERHVGAGLLASVEAVDEKLAVQNTGIEERSRDLAGLKIHPEELV